MLTIIGAGLLRAGKVAADARPVLWNQRVDRDPRPIDAAIWRQHFLHLGRSDAGTLVLLDIGTGAAVIGRELAAQGGTLKGHILIGHTHWDHIQGLPFFPPLFAPGNEWDIYAPRGLRQTVRETLAGQMQHSYFPVDLDQLGATIRYHDLVEGALRIGDIDIVAQYLNHPALTLGYRLQADGAAVVYACDHEPHSRSLADGLGEIEGQDRRHAQFLADADLVIHDAQYLEREYAEKVGWGHSTVEYAVRVARAAGAKRLALTHHDPSRTDDEVDAYMDALRVGTDLTGLDVFAAAEGLEIELSGAKRAPAPIKASAHLAVAEALVGVTILVAVATPRLIETLKEALEKEDIRWIAVAPEEATVAAAREHPSLLIVEDTRTLNAAASADAVRAASPEVAIVLVSTADREQAGPKDDFDDHFDDQLAEPFSSSYARARLRATLLRRAGRWQRAEKPRDEVKRIATLHALNILDTPPEERFDRITRLAAAVFNVPVALISLVDENRQWFKSVSGAELRETPRDQSFCSHAVVSRQPLVVPDTLLDARFAENPQVVGEPRARFYAGCPVIMADGSCIGTLCILDMRPRDLDEAGLTHLRDLADLAKVEFERTATVQGVAAE